VLRVVLALITTFVFIVGWSVGHALIAPGGGTAAERIAEWARNHYLGPLVTFGEWLTYNPPKTGGKPNVQFNHLGGTALKECKPVKTGTRAKANGSSSAKCASRYHGIQPLIPASIGSPAGRPLQGEGVWKVAVTVHGIPAVLKTYVRQSRTYSSYYAAIVSMDQRLLKFSLRPGTEDPGYGNWGAPMEIPAGHRLGLVATFNSGFRINASGGGFYLHGHYARALVKGVASEVYYRNGMLRIGTWGYGGLHMGPQVTAVRQNLRLVVINGKVPASVDQNVTSSWGATLGGGYNVWRSGVGITRDGRIVFVYGPALDVRTLADLLRRAGAVNAMQLDINPDWMSFMYYLPKGHPADPTPINLLPTQRQPPYRYYSIASRDFTAVYAR
jgi:Phosphodiester glycosidase